MKIAILTSGILPVPAVQGGAVENLVDFYLAYNEQHHLHDITVYSVWHPDVDKHPALKSEVNHYQYIHVDGAWAKLRKSLFMMTHRKKTYYHRSIAFFLHEAMKDIHRQQYDVVILENRPAYALELKKVTGARLVYHLHNDNLNNRVPRYQDIYDRADRILTVSDYIRGRVLTINTQDTKTRVVHNGIDLQAFAIGKERGNAEGGPFTIAFMGRVIPEKGIEELIDAMLQIRKYDIRLMVIGGSFYANSSPNAFEQKLREKAEPVRDRILFTGYVAHEQLCEYLGQADIAAFPSMWEEPFGLTVIEAMAAGLPVITTRSGGIPETCEDAAILLDREAVVDQLAKAIIDLYEHPEKRRQMSEAALQRSRQFDKETYARNFFQAIEDIT